MGIQVKTVLYLEDTNSCPSVWLTLILYCSDDGTATWCGLSMLPLATILHEHDLHKFWAMTPTGGKDREVIVYNENECTITCPVEPQVRLTY